MLLDRHVRPCGQQSRTLGLVIYEGLLLLHVETVEKIDVKLSQFFLRCVRHQDLDQVLDWFLPLGHILRWNVGNDFLVNIREFCVRFSLLSRHGINNVALVESQQDLLLPSQEVLPEIFSEPNLVHHLHNIAFIRFSCGSLWEGVNLVTQEERSFAAPIHAVEHWGKEAEVAAESFVACVVKLFPAGQDVVNNCAHVVYVYGTIF